MHFHIHLHWYISGNRTPIILVEDVSLFHQKAPSVLKDLSAIAELEFQEMSRKEVFPLRRCESGF